MYKSYCYPVAIMIFVSKSYQLNECRIKEKEGVDRPKISLSLWLVLILPSFSFRSCGAKGVMIEPLDNPVCILAGELGHTLGSDQITIPFAYASIYLPKDASVAIDG